MLKKIPNDFDDNLYLQLNSDIKSQYGNNPKLHYLKYGYLENRKYKVELPEDFNEVIKSENIYYNKCYIITDDPQNALSQRLKTITNATILKQDELQDLTFMKYASKMIISHSSFSWWSAFLGNQKKVYVPLSKYRETCLWSDDPAIDNVNLIPLNQKFIKKFI
jgi:hypothetical protein